MVRPYLHTYAVLYLIFSIFMYVIQGIHIYNLLDNMNFKNIKYQDRQKSINAKQIRINKFEATIERKYEFGNRIIPSYLQIDM